MDATSVTSKLKKSIATAGAMFLLAFPAFSQTYQTNGTAVNSGGGLVRMTAAGIGNQTASAWSTTRIDLTQPFDMSFDMFFGCDNGANGGDGMTFALQNDPRGLNAVGEGFGYLGYGGSGAITPSIAIEFDTYDGTAAGGGNELVADHIAVDINGDINQLSGANNFTGTSGTVTRQAILSGRDLEACAVNANNYYTIRVTWDPTAKVLRLYEEGTLTMTYTRDLVATVFGGSTLVYWGFTGATGTASNEQWIAPTGSIIPWQCSPATTCCTAYTVNTGGPTTVCSAPITLTVAGTTPAAAITGYSWSTGSTTSSTNVSTPGTYTVNVLQTQGATSCPGRATINVTSTGPSATISGSAQVCDDGVTTAPVSVAMTGAAPWSLTYAIDGVAQPPVTGIASSPYVINGMSVHTYTLVSVSNGAGCIGTTSGSAVINSYSGSPVGNDQIFTPPAAVPLAVNNSGGTYEWYDAPTGGTLLGTGPTYTTPVISAQTTYYVRNASLTAITNKSIAYLDRTEYEAGGNNTATALGLPRWDLWMDVRANSSFTLNSISPDINVTAAPQAAGSNVTIYIVDNTTATTTSYTLPISGYTTGVKNVTVPINYNFIAGRTYRVSYEGTGSVQGIMYWDFIGPRGPWGANPAAKITKDAEATFTVPNQGWYPGMFNWQITAGSPAFACGRTAITAIPDDPMPVTLLYFTATLQGPETVLLQWSTAMELNNDYFIIQRSADGVHFEDIGIIDGNGNSNYVINYQMYDEHALSGVSYYRLKQVDFDGQYAYSSIATVSNTGAGISFALYPNPGTAGAQLHLNLMGVTSNEAITVTIYDVLSRNVYTYTFTADASGNVISTFDLPTNIPAGTYVAEAVFVKGTERVKLVIQ